MKKKCNACSYEEREDGKGRKMYDDDLIPGAHICEFCRNRERAISDLLAFGKTEVGPFTITLDS